MSKYYITTPIYYVNDQPHIGHAYTTIAADVLSRYNRMLGSEVFFLTGTDEHGQKVQEAASNNNRTPKEHADLLVGNFKALWQQLGITNDAFIRTTDDHHKEVVTQLLQKLWDKGEIVKRTYEGWYCTPCERFWTEKDLVDNMCPDCGREVQSIEEDNYFFLMSQYQDWLIKHIESHPDFIMPISRRNEVLGFLKGQPLGDLCISRPKKRLSWGVELPFDSDYVTYVWFDALLNYYSATECHAPGNQEVCKTWWPAEVQLIGKDILTTHAVYWSCMLKAMGLALPKTIFAHGWWTIEGKKMSKSLGNVVNPAEMSERFGNDAFRYFLFREVPFGNDGNFSEGALIKRYNTDLANDLGNLASRTLKMAANYFDSVVPEPAETEQEFVSMTDAHFAVTETSCGDVNQDYQKLDFRAALEHIWEMVSFANTYIHSNAPWALAKEPEQEGRLRTVIYSSLEALRLLAINLYPFIPDASEKLYSALGQDGSPAGLALRDSSLNEWGGLKPGTKLADLENMFPRINTKEKKNNAKQKKQKKVQKPAEDNAKDNKDNLIKIDDFAKVVLKTGHVKLAERVEGSDKLIRLEVDTVDEGREPGQYRQIVAGIGKAYAPEDLVGKTVVIVANLKPAKLMGVKSEGMLLAATAEGGEPVILTTDSESPAGLRIK